MPQFPFLFPLAAILHSIAFGPVVGVAAVLLAIAYSRIRASRTRN